MRALTLLLAGCLLASGCGEDGETGEPVETSGLPLLVALGSASCVPCRMMQPELEILRNASSGSLNVVFIDVNHDRGAASRYRIRVIPTQVFYRPDGSEIRRHEGYIDARGMLAILQEDGFLTDLEGI